MQVFIYCKNTLHVSGTKSFIILLNKTQLTGWAVHLSLWNRLDVSVRLVLIINQM